jgi:hypothetical protein
MTAQTFWHLGLGVVGSILAAFIFFDLATLDWSGAQEQRNHSPSNNCIVGRRIWKQVRDQIMLHTRLGGDAL